MTDTVRHLILKDIVAKYSAVSELVHGLKFSTVALGPLGMVDQKKKYSLGIVAGKEKVTYQFPYAMCFLEIAVEFRITQNRGDDSSGDTAEQMLGLITQVILQDRQLGNLALDTKRLGSEIDLDTYSDRTVVGAVFFEVQYRTAHNDVYDPNPTV
jgi:hypothetical protein